MEVCNISKKILVWLLFPSALSCMEKIRVDTSGKLSHEELEYVRRREQNITRPAIAQLIGLPLIPTDMRLPRIALVGSGGGFRATIDYSAMLAALDYKKIYQCASHFAGLSGGGWALFTLILRRIDPFTYPLILRQRVCQKDPHEVENIISKFVRISKENHKIDLVDTWGAVVSEKLFGDLINGNNITFENIRKNLNPDMYPYPVCPVLIGQSCSKYDSLEINPFEIYSDFLGGAIPNYALGNIFEQGCTTLNNPQLSFEFYMGMIGSAFALSPGDFIYNEIKDLADRSNSDVVGEEIASVVAKFNEKLGAYEVHFFPAEIPNYSVGMAESKLNNESILQLIDGGLGANIPIQPLTRMGRNIDIYIVCDSSKEACDEEFTELRYAADWAYENDKKFPSLMKFKFVSESMQIFYEDDPTVPYVIYFSNKIPFGTTKMEYTQAEFDKLFGFMFGLTIDGIPAIVDAIKKKANALNPGLEIPNTFDSLPQGEVSQKCSCCIIL